MPALAHSRAANKLDHGAATVALLREDAIRDVSLVGDTVHDALPQTEGSCRCPVRAVGADHDVGRRVRHVDRRPLTYLHPALPRRVEQKGVESAALRHADHRLCGAALDRVTEAEAELEHVDLGFDDGRRVDGALPDGTDGQPTPARLVARERRLVDEQHARSGLGEAVGRRRSGGSPADHEHVEVLHEVEATIRDPGGVPERPKGTGCKPVGSAYGGSNPPAPTIFQQ